MRSGFAAFMFALPFTNEMTILWQEIAQLF
jgi:hypothetical protein